MIRIKALQIPNQFALLCTCVWRGEAEYDQYLYTAIIFPENPVNFYTPLCFILDKIDRKTPLPAE